MKGGVLFDQESKHFTKKHFYGWTTLVKYFELYQR